MSRRKTHEEYLIELKDKKIMIVPLENYISAKIKIKHKCICDNEWETTPDYVLKGGACGCIRNTSVRKKLLKSHSSYIKDLEEKNIKCVPLELYIGNKKKILHKCNCGNKWMVCPHDILIGITCGCKLIGYHKKIRTDHTRYIENLKNKNISVYPLEPYNSNFKKILHRCTCGNAWIVRPANVLNGQKCGCTKSISENHIASYLKSRNIYFENQFKFEDLKMDSYLFYDFAIYKNKELFCLIEYHGIQHYKFIPFFHKSKKGFEESKIRDIKKRNYAKSIGIPLIEMTHKDIDIFMILENELKSLDFFNEFEKLERIDPSKINNVIFTVKAYQEKRRKKYYSVIRISKEKIYSKNFDTPEEAIKEGECIRSKLLDFLKENLTIHESIIRYRNEIKIIPQQKNKSGHRNISYRPHNKRWCLKIKGIVYGLFKTLDEAVERKKEVLKELNVV